MSVDMTLPENFRQIMQAAATLAGTLGLEAEMKTTLCLVLGVRTARERR